MKPVPPPDRGEQATLPRPPLRLEVAAGIHGAMLLARGRPEGVLLASPSGEGAWRSCIALLICLPAVMALTLFTWGQDGWPAEGLLAGLAVQVIRLVLSWAGFLLMTEPLVAMTGRAKLWPRFVSAFNWSQVAQYLVLVVALILPRQLGLPTFIVEAAAIIGLGYTLWLEWFVTRWALQVNGGQAAALVGADFAIGILVGRIVDLLGS